MSVGAYTGCVMICRKILMHIAVEKGDKLGEKGLVYGTPTEMRRASAYDVDVVDSVAAGDAFGGALAVGLAEGMALSDAVRFGMAAGAIAVTRPGAQDAMPSRAEVDALIAGSKAL